MPLVHAKCTNCGAELEVDRAKDADICPYCGAPYVVKAAIRKFNVKKSQIVRAKCTNCGEELEVDKTKSAEICPYCNKPYVVWKAIRSFKTSDAGSESAENNRNPTHVEKRTDEFDLQNYLEHSDDLNILVKASYSYHTRIGAYKCMLVYKKYQKIISGTVQNADSTHRVIIAGLFDALGRIKLHNANICVISDTYIGFKGALKGKGVYVQEINQLIDLAEKQGNSLSSIAFTDGIHEIKKVMNRKLDGV